MTSEPSGKGSIGLKELCAVAVAALLGAAFPHGDLPEGHLWLSHCRDWDSALHVCLVSTRKMQRK